MLHHTSLLAEASFLRYSAGKRKEVSFHLANQIPGKRGLCLQGNTIHQNFFSSREVRLVCRLDSTIQPLNDSQGPVCYMLIKSVLFMPEVCQDEESFRHV